MISVKIKRIFFINWFKLYGKRKSYIKIICGNSFWFHGYFSSVKEEIKTFALPIVPQMSMKAFTIGCSNTLKERNQLYAIISHSVNAFILIRGTIGIANVLISFISLYLGHWIVKASTGHSALENTSSTTCAEFVAEENNAGATDTEALECLGDIHDMHGFFFNKTTSQHCIATAVNKALTTFSLPGCHLINPASACEEE